MGPRKGRLKFVLVACHELLLSRCNGCPYSSEFKFPISSFYLEKRGVKCQMALFNALISLALSSWALLAKRRGKESSSRWYFGQVVGIVMLAVV